jgi:hypothetical protein
MKLSQAALPAFLATSLIFTPIVANAGALEGARSSATVEGEGLSGGTGPAWLVAVALVAALGIVVLSDDDEDPVSP